MTHNSAISDTISSPEPSEFLKADRYLMQIWQQGYLSLEEAERRALVSELFKRAVFLNSLLRTEGEGRSGLLEQILRSGRQQVRGSPLQGTFYSLDRGHGAGGRGLDVPFEKKVSARTSGWRKPAPS